MTTCGMCETVAGTAQLCTSCTRALDKRLGRMPRLYAALAPFLTPTATREPGGTPAGRTEAPLPVVEHVLDLRGPGGIVGILEDWRAAMYRDRGQTAPASTGAIETRIAHAADTLRSNLPAIAAEWPAAGLLAREIRDLEQAVATITGAVNRPRGTRLGPCPAQHADGTLCGATLRLAPGARVITCPWCATTYPPATWTGLHALIAHDTQDAVA
ncbi:hypothetical protein GCM10010363_07840 [Streptomyces omiyaensis]|uniref:hypothetical protein n=1 Tax=Streptomyces omiyaensis TaxID=68247 RepID=UPI0019BDCB4E|nr:hypothetical protein [Streptomyces omiyaensis]GGY29800.1 hypothetical protein GCM10010363_07840 [Streptomyces omiyaensis]